NGLYVYNTNTPQIPGSPGSYRPYANEARLRFASGGFVFENVQPTQGIEINVFGNPSGDGLFNISSQENKPLSNGAMVDGIWLEFFGNGNVTTSDALPTVAPILDTY